MSAPAKKWSPLQQDIFHFVQKEKGNAIVEAVAGSGKTTTIAEAVARVVGNSIFLAFNKSIAEELKSRGVNARTFHSLTYSLVLKFKNASRVDDNKLRRLCDAKLKGDDVLMYGSFICRLVGLARQAGVGCLIPDTEQTWMDICLHHDLEPESETADLGRGLELAAELLQHSNESPMVDFDDLLYLAVKEGIALPKYDFVFVDEAQDTNAIQRAILRKIMHQRSRLVAVGDPAQAIYGFRGADSESLNLIAQEFECKRLPLSITYRCPTSVVTYAKQWVNHIESAPSAAEGKVTELKNADFDLFASGDLVVCRKTAPLISLAFKFLKNKKAVKVMGRDIGAGLEALIKRMNTDNLVKLTDKLNAYKQREVEKAIAKKEEAKAEAIGDKVDSILCLIQAMGDGSTTKHLIILLKDLFADKNNATILSTIHKAKGLEADRVFWLGRGQCPAKWAKQDWQKQQEINLCYVAATRSKNELFLIEADF